MKNTNRHPAASTSDTVSFRLIARIWWPLAFSWLLMGFEMPALSAVIARLAHAEINLAAYGGIVFPLALIMEAPILMLLAASTALSAHKQAYERIWRFMMTASAVLTGLHILVAFTPLYYFVVRVIIGAPEEIIEPARSGLMIMVPWTWSIAYRRIYQGIMIRYGYSGAVGMGTIVRLVSGGLVLLVGYLVKTIPGVMVGAAAQAVGVMSEAIYAGWRVRPVIRGELAAAPVTEQLTWRAFASFYIPLALTSMIQLLWQPVGSAALSRMPEALGSLAAWPALSGITFLLRSFGIAYNEVVVALLSRTGSLKNLRRFALLLFFGSTAIYVLFAATPLSALYFRGISALPERLVSIARLGMLIGLPLPGLSVYQSWFQGILLHSRNTRGVPESVVVFFGTILIVLGTGVAWNQVAGIYFSMIALTLASAAQMVWLWFRSRPALRQVELRDAGLPPTAHTLA